MNKEQYYKEQYYKEQYYTEQIITYMGNKRKVIPHIEPLIQQIKEILGKDKLAIGEGFSGSGVVSRLFKNHASTLYVNDLAGYSKTINQCYLANPSKETLPVISNYIQQANAYVSTNVSSSTNSETKFIQRYWAPKDTDHIQEGERVYYTKENGRRIDMYQEFIQNQVPEEYRPYLLAPLLAEASKHNNCSGNFAAFYKKDKIGHFGGKNENDIKRITQNIELPLPLFSVNDCKVNISQKDVNEWVKEIPELDLVYYDPPYNKHPYHIYYFLLDIINNWDTTIEIPDTFRGQPKNWEASLYNSHSKANEAFDSLIKNTRAKYILVSYNNEGIINEKEMKEILSKYGEVKEHFIEHATYNRMKGIAEYKKNAEKETAKIKECLYLLRK
jgi:adenine-specific DNA-methyltransferase